MKRESGWYWVKFTSDDEYEIARWLNSRLAWQIIGSGLWFYDDDFIEINPKIIIPPQQSPEEK